ncbi:MAG: hypothetical protein JWN70_3300 [Planctomycetaceae bacterium]|nr:hypothetical protein [Planctomycetaceae bacterium]
MLRFRTCRRRQARLLHAQLTERLLPGDENCLNWTQSSDEAKIYAALGSYHLSVSASDVTSTSASLTSSGYNATNLGSAIGPNAQSRILLDLIGGSSGAFSYTHQTYSWTENVTYNK